MGKTDAMSETEKSFIRIVVLDDDDFFLGKVVSLCNKICSENSFPAQIDKYTSAACLKWDLEEKKKAFDIYILDIELGEENGMELARYIRSFDENAYIIFLTSYLEYSLEGYECNAYRYILKNSAEEKLTETMKNLCRKIYYSVPKVHIIENQNTIEKIRLNEIIYLYKESKYTYFVLLDRTTRERKPINEVITELGNTQFMFLEKGIAVNLDHVMNIQNMTVTMRNNVVFHCSRTHIKQLKEAIRNTVGVGT